MTLLQRWMETHGETDETLRLKVGISRVQIYRLRAGQHRPSPRTALKLESVTGIPAAKFIFDGLAPAPEPSTQAA